MKKWLGIGAVCIAALGCAPWGTGLYFLKYRYPQLLEKISAETGLTIQITSSQVGWRHSHVELLVQHVNNKLMVVSQDITHGPLLYPFSTNHPRQRIALAYIHSTFMPPSAKVTQSLGNILGPEWSQHFLQATTVALVGHQWHTHFSSPSITMGPLNKKPLQGEAQALTFVLGPNNQWGFQWTGLEGEILLHTKHQELDQQVVSLTIGKIAYTQSEDAFTAIVQPITLTFRGLREPLSHLWTGKSTFSLPALDISAVQNNVPFNFKLRAFTSEKNTHTALQGNQLFYDFNVTNQLQQFQITTLPFHIQDAQFFMNGRNFDAYTIRNTWDTMLRKKQKNDLMPLLAQWFTPTSVIESTLTATTPPLGNFTVQAALSTTAPSSNASLPLISTNTTPNTTLPPQLVLTGRLFCNASTALVDYVIMKIDQSQPRNTQALEQQNNVLSDMPSSSIVPLSPPTALSPTTPSALSSASASSELTTANKLTYITQKISEFKKHNITLRALIDDFVQQQILIKQASTYQVMLTMRYNQGAWSYDINPIPSSTPLLTPYVTTAPPLTAP